jgi:hypothetical protein
VSQEKYIGMDVHQATISVAVMDARGKLIMECLLETKTTTIIEFIRGLHGSLSLTSEEGTSAAWLHDLLKPHVSRLVVCDPRKNALLKDGSKSSPLRQPFRCPRLTAGISRTSMGGNIPAIDAAQTANRACRCLFLRLRKSGTIFRSVIQGKWAQWPVAA